MSEWIGKTIGKVRIEKYLARGGMAEVFLGTHLTLERRVAVKVMHSFVEDDPELYLRFQREAGWWQVCAIPTLFNYLISIQRMATHLL